MTNKMIPMVPAISAVMSDDPRSRDPAPCALDPFALDPCALDPCGLYPFGSNGLGSNGLGPRSWEVPAPMVESGDWVRLGGCEH
jgi:hypothetical protein